MQVIGFILWWLNTEVPSSFKGITELLADAIGHRYYTKIDLKSGFHNLRVKEEDKWKTAFMTHAGVYEWNVMPFGLKNAPSTFQRWMNTLLGALPWCSTYIDDILIWADSEPQLVDRTRIVLNRLRKGSMTASIKKTLWNKERMEYLGYVISSHGAESDPEKTKAMTHWV